MKRRVRALKGMALAAMWSAAVFGQPIAPVPRFEVASVKVNRSSQPESGEVEHGRLTFRAAAMRHLVASAYEMRLDLVSGGPGWTDTDRFDIDAKFDPNASEHMWRVMLQNLLSERFKLTVHREKRSTRVLVLTVAKGGPKLNKSTEDPGVRSRCIGSHPMTCTQRTMAEFADVLRRNSTGIEVPVLDETGLDGRYDFKLIFAEPSASPAHAKGKDEDVPIFEALESQLGLKLKDAKRPIEFLVIDRVNRVPTEN
ncbi:MAG TPA: TIGR03435 family protein [Bryobacteraceae bacterium]